MRVRSIAFFISVLLVAAAAAQATPDFTGTWVEDVSKRISVPPAAWSGGATMAAGDTAVRQTPTAVTIELPFELPFMRGIVRYVYRLDGAESRNHNGADTLVSRSRWEGRKLVTEGALTSVTSQGEGTGQFTEIRYLRSPAAMVVETTYRAEGSAPRSTTRVFARKP